MYQFCCLIQTTYPPKKDWWTLYQTWVHSPLFSSEEKKKKFLCISGCERKLFLSEECYGCIQFRSNTGSKLVLNVKSYWHLRKDRTFLQWNTSMDVKELCSKLERTTHHSDRRRWTQKYSKDKFVNKPLHLNFHVLNLKSLAFPKQLAILI